MKMKQLLLMVAMMFMATHVMAANVDVSTAQAKAQQFLMSQSGKNVLKTHAPAVKWVHQERNSSKSNLVAYYVVNTDDGFVIVAGDDRAQEILAYGPGSLDNMNNLPENMLFWLDHYKQQMEYLQAHPGMVVEKHSLRANLGQSVAPMLEAMWNQGYPYYSQCPMIESASVRAQTGCAATSLAQVFYYWKYPNQPTPVIPGYTTKTYGLVLDPLPSVTFDWANILPTYNFNDYTQNDEHHRAIAQLMRYVGQAEQMDYTDKFGEANEDGILRACHTFGYVNAQIAYKSILYSNGVDSVYIDNDTWEEMLQGELIAGRPVVYCGVSYSSAYEGYYGHAFNVDGYDASNGKYSINWGWSGVGNGYFSLNAFSNQGNSYVLNQLMIMGIEPPAPVESYDPVMQPVDSTYITLTSFRANWTDATPDENVISYTLEVNPGDGSNHGVYEKVLSEPFPYCTSTGSDPITKLDNYTLNKGWTGSYVYEANGGLRLGSASRNGSLTTPAMDMTQSGGKMTVMVTVKPYNSTNVPFKISCGTSIVELTVSAEDTYTVVLDCEANESQKVTFATTESGKRVIVNQVDIYSSTASKKMMFNAPVETGDSTMRVITDITNKFYTVSGLTAGGTFNYRVKAHYVNGTQSEWSNLEVVTLFDNGPAPHEFEAGDVNHDSIINISDVTILIDYLLDNSNEICTTCADVTSDGLVNISDVTALIDYLLSSN